MASRWSDVLGVIWIPSTLPSHFFAQAVFVPGVLSAPSALLEPRNPGVHGLPKGLIFRAPGFPSSLLIGDAIIELLDRTFHGAVKEVAGVDPFGRPCVEALCGLNDLFNEDTKYASPIFNHNGTGVLEALETRRIS